MKEAEFRVFCAVALLVAGWAGGCIGDDEVDANAATFPTAPSGSGVRLPNPNFMGDWSSYEGDFLLYRITSAVKVINTTSGREINPSKCAAPIVYKLYEGNSTLAISRYHSAHPAEPGAMRMVYLNEATLGKCRYSHLFVINEGSPPNAWCERGFQFSGMAPADWHCSVAVDYSSKTGLLWEHISLEFDDATGELASVILNNETVPANSTSQMDISMRVPGRSWIEISANVTLQPIGRWPYSSVARY